MKFNSRLLRLAQLNQPALILTITLGAAGASLAVGQAWLLARLINRVFLENHSLADSYLLLGALLLAAFLRSTAAAGMEINAHAISRRVKHYLRLRLYKSLVEGGPAGFRGDEKRTGELANTLVEGIETIEPFFSQYLPQLALSVLAPVIVLAFVFPLDLLSGVVLLITAPLIPIFMILIGQVSGSLTKKQWLSLSRLSAYFLDVLHGLTTLKFLGRSKDQVSRLARANELFRQTTMNVLRVTFLSAFALELVATISTAVVAVQVGLRLLYGYIPFEQAFFVLILAPEFYLPLRMLGARFHAGMSGAAAAERIFAILDEVNNHPEVCSTHSESGLTAFTYQDPVAVEFRDIHFTYPDGRRALQGLSFRSNPGEITALVGTSGAGKSTAAALLLRFLVAQAGQIAVNGYNLADIPAEKWREQVAWVPQIPYLFNDTIAANIRLGCPGASLEKVIQAAEKANAHTFIEALPQGYNTLIGERGAALSGGQAQRVALARAFIMDAPLLIFDEPTSSLDPETEKDLIEAIQRLAAGRTTLIIAHRLASVAGADNILVIEGGRLVESGTHVELLEKGCIYPRLVQAGREAQPAGQNRSFLDPAEFRDYFPYKQADMEPGPAPFPAVGTLRRLLQFLKPYSAGIAASALLGFGTLGSGIGLMAASAFIISKAALQPSIAELQVAIVGVRFFGIARAVFRYLERYVSHHITFSLLANLRTWFYERIEPLAPARLIRHHSGDLLNRAIGDIAYLENFYVRAVAPPMAALLAALTAALYLAGFEPILALGLGIVLIAAGVLLPIGILLLARQSGRQLVRARAKLSTVMVDGIQGLADLLAFGQERNQISRVAAVDYELAKVQNRLSLYNAGQTFFNVLLPNIGLLAVLVLAIPLVSNEQIEGVYLAVLALIALTSFEGTLPLGAAAHHMESSLESSRRLFELTDSQPEVSDPASPLPVPEAFALQVSDLYFRYPNTGLSTSNWAVEGLSFKLPAGGRLALVGPSGAGKSTLANLLLRFWDYGGQNGSGKIFLNGNELRFYQQDDLRQAIGIVSQSTYLFTGTLWDNLLLARPGASEDEITQAARLAQIHDFILSLPLGYQTQLGEGGLNLSGGQRQRLAIARALIANPRLVILDEATTNLDPHTERQVLESIRQAMNGLTCLTITHRLIGMEWMDEIIVIKNGREVERGAHEYLIKQGGFYQRMWEIQNKWIA